MGLRVAKFSFLPSGLRSFHRSHADLRRVGLVVALVASSPSLAERHDQGPSANSRRPIAESPAPLVAQVLNGTLSKFPEVVRLSDGEGDCSGTFVSTRVIITAAHCLAEKTGSLLVTSHSGEDLGTAHCEKSPRAGKSPLARNGLRRQSNVGERCSASASGQIRAQCGGPASLVFSPPFGVGFVPPDPRLGGFVPGGPPSVIPGPGAPPGGGIPDGAISAEDVSNDVAACVITYNKDVNPVSEQDTACLDNDNSLPRSMLLVGYGLANNGRSVIEDGKQRKGSVVRIRPGPVDGILEGFSNNLSNGPDASSAPGDSGGFVGVRGNDGRLKLRAVVSGGNAIVDGVGTGGRRVPRLNTGEVVSAFVDLRSEKSLSFLRDFAAKNKVSICGLDGGSGSALAAGSSADRNATVRSGDSTQVVRAPQPAASGVSGSGAFRSPAFAFPGSLGFPGAFGFPGQGFGFPRSFGFPGFAFGNPGEQGVVNPALGGLGFFPGAFGSLGGFGNPFLTPRFVRLRNGRLAIIDPFGVGRFGILGFGRFGSFGGLGFGRFGSFGGFGFGRSAFPGSNLAGFGGFDRFGALPAGSLLGFRRFGLLGGNPFGARFFRLR